MGPVAMPTCQMAEGLGERLFFSMLTQEIKPGKLCKTKWVGSANGLNRQNISM